MRSSKIDHPGPTTSWLSYWVGRLWMMLFGWDVEGEVPDAPRAVFIAAPHTSNWDLPHMLAASFVFRLRLSWMGKHTIFRPPFGGFMRWLGGIPIDRTAPHGVVSQVASRINASDKLVVAVPPSGTRKKRSHWKSGFYWIAHEAQVPIVCGYLDYARRRAGIGFSFLPTGDPRRDMDRVREFYGDIGPKFAELLTVPLLKEEERPDEPS